MEIQAHVVIDEPRAVAFSRQSRNVFLRWKKSNCVVKPQGGCLGSNLTLEGAPHEFC